MATFAKKLKNDGTYHAPAKGEEHGLRVHQDEEIAEWANDPMCIDREACSRYLERRKHSREQAAKEAEQTMIDHEKRLAVENAQLLKRKELLTSNPFDPRTEISADAQHIAGRVVKTLWIIFVLIPVIATILFEILK